MTWRSLAWSMDHIFILELFFYTFGSAVLRFLSLSFVNALATSYTQHIEPSTQPDYLLHAYTKKHPFFISTASSSFLYTTTSFHNTNPATPIQHVDLHRHHPSASSPASRHNFHNPDERQLRLQLQRQHRPRPPRRSRRYKRRHRKRPRLPRPQRRLPPLPPHLLRLPI